MLSQKPSAIYLRAWRAARVVSPEEKARRKEEARVRYQNNRKDYDKYALGWATRNPEKSKLIKRRAQLKRFYGLTFEEFEAMWKSQGGRCALCDVDLPLIDKNTHVDHCHKTRKVRGVLCKRCNIRLGYLEQRELAGTLRDLKYLNWGLR